MKILITGGAGFLGLHLAKYAEKRGFLNPTRKNAGKYELYLLDIALFDKSEYPRGCHFIQADIRDVQTIKRLTKNIDVVIHAAAALPLWKKDDIFDINVNGTKSVLDSALQNKVKRFIYISSTAVYGVPEKHPIYENDTLVGVGAYGASKIEAEKLCEDYRKKGIVITIIRPKTFVGTHRLGIFEILFDWIKDGKKIPVIGDGNNRYQLLDVDDLVEAIYRCIVLKDVKKANQTFNIGAERFETVKEDLNALFEFAYYTTSRRPSKSCHKRSEILQTPAWLVKKLLWVFEKLKLSPLYEWVYGTADKDSCVSITKLNGVLRWHPKYSNAQALIKSYQWYLDNYEKIKSHPPGVTHTTGWKQGILGLFKRFL